MKISYTYFWPFSGLESIVEIGNGYILKGVYNPRDLSTRPEPTQFELPDDGRLECLLQNIKQLHDGEIGKPSVLTAHPQVLSISNIGYFKWHTKTPPPTWRILSAFIKYLHISTKEIKQPSFFHDSITMEEYCRILMVAPNAQLSR